MLKAASMPHALAAEYARECARQSQSEPDQVRRQELARMAENLQRVPWEAARTFWEGCSPCG